MRGQRAQWLAVGVIVLILGATLTVGVMLSEDMFPVSVGSKAPDFTAVDLTTQDTVTLADYEGDVVLLNLWATWCAPCREEMPSMERLYNILGPEGLKIVAVSVDFGSDEVEEFVEEFGLTFDILHDKAQRVDAIYQTTGLPESFVIDRHGVIVKKTWGMEWDDPAQVAFLRRLLSDGETGTDPAPTPQAEDVTPTG